MRQLFSDAVKCFCFLLNFVILFIVDQKSISAVVHSIKDAHNFDEIIASTEIVFVNFHANWCRFSQMLTPIFEAASNEFHDDTKVKFVSIDCDRQVELAQKYNINKYPVLKLFRFGKPAKREYKGSRSVEAIREHIQSQQKDVIQIWANEAEMIHNVHPSKPTVIANLKNKESPEFYAYRHIASALGDYCDFHVIFNPSMNLSAATADTLNFQSANIGVPPDSYHTDPFKNYNDSEQWITDRCIPLVREITFANAEDLTEEGLPFMLLFRQKDDEASLEEFTKSIKMSTFRDTITALHADGEKFSHPLHHLGKSINDLPLIAIDSFKHMYLFPNFQDIKNRPNKLEQFVMDMQSGKLHREFHYGPDSTFKPEEPPSTDTVPGTMDLVGQTGDQLIFEANKEGEMPPKSRTQPPESIFQKLKPSKWRYSLKKDEL